MAIRTVVTSGFGNGTFDGTIALVVTRGYGAAVAVAPPAAVVAPDVVGGWRPIPLPQFEKLAPIELAIGPAILTVWGSVLFELTTPAFLAMVGRVRMGVAKPLEINLVIGLRAKMPVFDKAWNGDWLSRELTVALDQAREAEEARLLGLI